MGDCTDCGGREHLNGSRADVDESAWDGPAAMSSCAKSETPATCYEAICAGRKAGDADKQASWALPHHKGPGKAPNEAGVRNALARIDQTDGLTNKAAAQAHLEAHMKAIGADDDDDDAYAKKLSGTPRRRMPKENLVRGLFRTGPDTAVILLRERSNGTSSGIPTLEGHFAVFNEWTEIDSWFEGNFMESIAPGAFSKTFKENQASMRCLFQHGRDPVLGDKPLGPIEELSEDSVGAHYVVPMLDTAYNAELVPGLREGLYGASFRFSVVKDEVDKSPERSDYNPNGLPERVIREMQVMEFGPVTFPAYESASASLRSGGMRSLTVDWIARSIFGDPDVGRDFLKHLISGDDADPPPSTAPSHSKPTEPGPPHSSGASRSTSVPQQPRRISRDEFLTNLERRR